MNNSITLKEAIGEVLKCQHENGHPESYLTDLRRTYNRLLGHAEQLGTGYLSHDLVTQFLADAKIPGLVNIVTNDSLPITDAYDFGSLIWKQETYPFISSMSLSEKLFPMDYLKP